MTKLQGPRVIAGVLALRSRLTQALGRLPWFAPFFLRARRLRPVLPIRKPPCNNCKESQSLIPQRGVEHSAASHGLAYSVSRTGSTSKIPLVSDALSAPLCPLPWIQDYAADRRWPTMNASNWDW